MDTEAFLLKRSQLVEQLANRRQLALAAHDSERGSASFLGFPVDGIPGILLSLIGRSEIGSWLPRLLVSTVVPITLAFIRRKSRFGRLLDFLPLSRFGL